LVLAGDGKALFAQVMNKPVDAPAGLAGKIGWGANTLKVVVFADNLTHMGELLAAEEDGILAAFRIDL